jgi:hypothetical protein
VSSGWMLLIGPQTIRVDEGPGAGTPGRANPNAHQPRLALAARSRASVRSNLGSQAVSGRTSCSGNSDCPFDWRRQAYSGKTPRRGRVENLRPFLPGETSRFPIGSRSRSALHKLAARMGKTMNNSGKQPLIGRQRRGNIPLCICERSLVLMG